MLNEKIFYEDQLPVKLKVVNIKNWNAHYHDDIEIVYVLNGEINLKNVHYTYTLKSGDVFILNDREMHSLSADSDNMALIVYLNLKYFMNYFDELHNSFFITDLSNEDENMGLLRKNLATLLSEYMIKDNDFEKRLVEYANNLLSCLITDFRYFTLEEGMFTNESKNRGNTVLAERLRRVTDYIYENHAQKITLSEVAENVHLSDYYLSHLIKTFTGLSFQEYLNFARVEESEKLLLGTTKSVSVIAEECGFSAARYYTKFFQKWFGVTPGEYRKQYLKSVHKSKGKSPYIEYDEETIMEFLRKEYKEILLGIRQVKKIKIESIDIDMTQENPGMSQNIREALNFYCNVEDLSYYFEEITTICGELEIGTLNIRMNSADFYFKEIDKLFHSHINICFELCESMYDVKEIVNRLIKRYGEDIKIEIAKEEWQKPEKNFVYDSIAMIPRVLRKLTLNHPETRYRLIDSCRSTALTNGEDGMLNSFGMRKPVYYAYKMISDLIKGEIVAMGEGYAVSLYQNTVRVMIYAKPTGSRKYTDPDKLLQTMNGEVDVEEKIVKLHNISGKFRVQHYSYESQNGLLNVHGNFGYRNSLTKEEEDFVKWVTVPSTGFFATEALGLLTLNVKLSPNAAYMFIINPE